MLRPSNTDLEMQVMIHNTIADILTATQKAKQPDLLLTQEQYDIDPDFWKKVIKQKGGRKEDIIIVPSMIKE